MEKIKQKQIVLENNIIEIYQKVLKNDKEKSQFLLKIFKFLIENNENFKVNDKLEGIFVAIKPSLKVKEFNSNWGGKRDNAGRKNNDLDNSNNNQLENQLENEIDNQNNSSSFKEIKYKDIKHKEIKYEDIKEIEKEKNGNDFVDYQFVEEEYKKGDFEFDLSKFWIFWKDKALKKNDLTNKLISWDIKDRDKRKNQSLKNNNLYGQFKFL